MMPRVLSSKAGEPISDAAFEYILPPRAISDDKFSKYQ
jgi:hypothetical protein